MVELPVTYVKILRPNPTWVIYEGTQTGALCTDSVLVVTEPSTMTQHSPLQSTTVYIQRTDPDLGMANTIPPW